MRNLASSIGKVLDRWADGLVAASDLRAEVTEELCVAMDRGDPDVVDVVLGLATREDADPALVTALADVARLCACGVPRWPAGAARLGQELREVLTARMSTMLATTRSPAATVDLVTALPADWCTSGILRAVAEAGLDGGDRLRVDRHLLAAAMRLQGGAAAFDSHVRPHLRTGTPDAMVLLVDAFLQPGLRSGDRAVLAEQLTSQADTCPTPALLRLTARLAAHGADGRAVPLATHLAARDDLPPQAPPVLGLVLWLGGAREQGRAVARLEPAWPDRLGWATQASRSVAAFLAATDAEPHEVLALCAAGVGTERPGTSIASVGALVGRLAVLRMRAYLALDDRVWAAREAGAVVTYHAYRGYALHMQGPDQEFEVALTDRLAVTAAEVAEARAVIEGIGGPEVGRLVLSEGALVLVAGSAAR